MSVSLNIKAFAGKDSPEFQKHFKAVNFCIENKLSFPKETSEFFKGKIDGGDLEDVIPQYLIDHIKDGVEVDLPIKSVGDYTRRIKVADIPKEVDEIIIWLE
jgi:hypothetical protein